MDVNNKMEFMTFIFLLVNQYLVEFGKSFLLLLAEMAPYLLLGFFIAGVLHVYFPKEYLQKYLGKNNKTSVFLATLLGIPLPLCSCGVIPTAVGLHKEGASKGATTAFLISTPQTGIDSIFATYGMLGWVFAIFRPLIALITGIIGGLLVNVFEQKSSTQVQIAVDECEVTNQKKSEPKYQQMLKYGFITLLDDIAKWLLIGLLLATLFSVLLPDDFLVNYFQNTWLSMLLVLVIAIPLYVCATGSIPIALVLFAKGLSMGSILVFLMAGPATNISTITVLSKTLGKRNTIIYLFTIIINALIFGYLIDVFIPIEWFNFHKMNHEHGLMWWHYGSALTLGLLLCFSIVKKIKNKYLNNMKTKNMEVVVNGMMCNHCKANVEKNLTKLDGIDRVEVNIDTKTVTLEGEVSLDIIKNTVNDLGYEYVGEK